VKKAGAQKTRTKEIEMFWEERKVSGSENEKYFRKKNEKARMKSILGQRE
jgi:hypothetical protein